MRERDIKSRDREAQRDRDIEREIHGEAHVEREREREREAERLKPGLISSKKSKSSMGSSFWESKSLGAFCHFNISSKGLFNDGREMKVT